MPRPTHTDRKVKVVIPEGVEVTLSVLGVTVPVTSRPDGQFYGQHRKERLSYGDFDALRKSIESVETEASMKRERVRRLKEAETQPEPALLYRSGTVQPMNRRRRPQRGDEVDQAAVLEPISVRGVDKRSGLALIIRENGDKESMSWEIVLRPLAGVEKKKLLDLAEKEQRAIKEVPEPVRVSDVLDKLPEVTVEATWDEFREAWVAKYGKDEIVVPSGYLARDDMESRILARHIIKHTPYRFTDTSGTTPIGLIEYVDNNRENYSSLATYDSLFKTEAEVHALKRAIMAARKAEERREKYLDTLRFDHSIFTD